MSETQTAPSPAEAARKLLEEIKSHGFARMIDLDPYFGTVEIPLEAEVKALAQAHPEAFAFFKEYLDDLREEIEIHFETTEMYEDEEFDQFVEDCRIIKERYTEEFAGEKLAQLEKFVEEITQA